MIKDDCGGIWLDWPHVITLFDSDGSERDYLPERTCKVVDYNAAWKGVVLFICSECGNVMPKDDNYCSNCGAKVVKE